MGYEHKVYKLKKALYSLKQAPRAQNKKIDSFFTQNGFEKYSCDYRLYVKVLECNTLLLVCLYVDDLLITGNNEEEISSFKDKMKYEFKMIDLGLLSYFLGIQFKQTPIGIVMHQSKYATDIL